MSFNKKDIDIWALNEKPLDDEALSFWFYPWKYSRVSKEVCNFFNKFLGERALDIGCGHGVNTLYNKLQGRDVIGLNVSMNGISCAKYLFKENGLKGKFLIADATNLPFENDFIEYVYSIT